MATDDRRTGGSSFPPVCELVPHSAPMLALEELLDWAPGRATAGLTLSRGTLLAPAEENDATVVLEFIAQTIAACLGYEALQLGRGPRRGMMIACRSLELTRPTIVAGERLLVRVQRTRGTDHVSLFDGQVLDAADRLVARASMTLTHGPEPTD